MRDRRENILARLFEIAAAIEGVTVYRNAEDATALTLPAIDIRDGNEEAQGLQSPKYSGVDMIVMTPTIAVMASGRDMQATLSTIRMALRKAITTDSALRDETGPNGNIRYISSATQDQWGATLHGEERIVFEFTYPLKPADFE